MTSMSEADKPHRLSSPVSERDHIRGRPDAPLTPLEYGDYECDYCGAAFPVVRAVREHFGERLRFVFRNFPHSSIHPHASVAAQAAEGGRRTRKVLADARFALEHQERIWPSADLTHYALQVGLELYHFQSDLQSERFAKRVEDDHQGGIENGVRKTPTFFINDVYYDGPMERDAMIEAISSGVIACLNVARVSMNACAKTARFASKSRGIADLTRVGNPCHKLSPLLTVEPVKSKRRYAEFQFQFLRNTVLTINGGSSSIKFAVFTQVRLRRARIAGAAKSNALANPERASPRAIGRFRKRRLIRPERRCGRSSCRRRADHRLGRGTHRKERDCGDRPSRGAWWHSSDGASKSYTGIARRTSADAAAGSAAHLPQARSH